MPSAKFDRERAQKVGAAANMNVVALLGDTLLGPCPYRETHEHTYWRLVRVAGRTAEIVMAGPTTCGICHPPAPGLHTISVDRYGTPV